MNDETQNMVLEKEQEDLDQTQQASGQEQQDSNETQQDLEPIPWEDEIADAFGVDNSEIEEPKPSFEVAEPAVKKRPKLALILAGVLPLVLFVVCWGGISFVQALGSIVSESKQAKTHSPLLDDSPQLELENYRTRLYQKNRRDQIEGFNASAKDSQKPAPQKAAPKVPPNPSPAKPPSPKRIAAPRIVYRSAPPAPKPQPRITTPVPPKPKPAAKPVSKPRSQPTRVAAPPRSVYAPPQPKLSAIEQWDQLASLNTMGSNGAAQNLDFEVDENGISEYKSPAPETPSQFPVGLTAEAKLLDSLSFKGVNTLPVALELMSPLGEIPSGSKLSAQASIADGVVTFNVQGYENLYGYEAITDAQIMASAPAKLKGGGQKSGLLGDLLSIGSDVLGESTGQSIDFDGNGRISSVQTATSNDLLDRVIGTGADVMSKRLKESSGSQEKYFKLKKGEIVMLSVLGG